MAYKRTFKKAPYRRRATRKPRSTLLKTIKSVVKRQAEMKVFDSKVTSVQVLSAQLSNTSSYRCDFGTDIPLFSNSAATQDGRVGTQIDIRKIEWAGRFRLVSSLWSSLHLRFILVRFNQSAGAQPTVGKIVTDASVPGQVYNQSIAADTPYTILMDKRYNLRPPSTGAALPVDFNVRFKWRTPKAASRHIEYSQNNISLDYTAVMKGLIRLYWISDQDLSDPAYTSLQSSWSRVSYVDM